MTGAADGPRRSRTRAVLSALRAARLLGGGPVERFRAAAAPLAAGLGLDRLVLCAGRVEAGRIDAWEATLDHGRASAPTDSTEPLCVLCRWLQAPGPLPAGRRAVAASRGATVGDLTLAAWSAEAAPDVGLLDLLLGELAAGCGIADAAPGAPLQGMVVLDSTGTIDDAVGDGRALWGALEAGTRARWTRELVRSEGNRRGFPRRGGRRVDGGWVLGTRVPGGSKETTCLVLVPALPGTVEAFAAATDALDLTVRERDVAREVVRGRSNDEIAVALGVSPNTVKTHLAAACRKAGVRGRARLAAVLLGRD